MGWRLLLILSLLLPGAAGAYPTPVDFDGTPLRWDITDSDGPITYEIEADGDNDEAIYGSAVDESAAMWSDVPTSYFEYVPAATGETAKVTIHLQNTLTGAPYSSGYAIFDEYDDSGKPAHCSIYVAVGGVSYGSVEKTLLHELGHCVGLGHSLIPEAIMSYRLAENGFRLDIDDEAAITRLYPADGSEPKLPPGCATGPPLRGMEGILVLLLLLPLAMACFPRLQLNRAEIPGDPNDDELPGHDRRT